MATIIPSEVCALSNAREDAAMPCWTCAHPWTARQAAGMTATAWEAIKAQHKPNKAALGEPNAWTAQVSVAVTAWPIVAIVQRLPARSASFGARAFRLGTLPTTGIALSPSRVGSCQATGMRRSAQGAPWALTRPSCGASTFPVAMAPCHGARLPGGPAVGRAGASPSRPALGHATQNIHRANVAIGAPQSVWVDEGQSLAPPRTFLGVTVCTQGDRGGQHRLRLHHHQHLAGPRGRPRPAQGVKAMGPGGARMALEPLRAVSRPTRWQRGLQGPSHRGRLPHRIPDQRSRTASCHMVSCIRRCLL